MDEASKGLERDEKRTRKKLVIVEKGALGIGVKKSSSRKTLSQPTVGS